MKLFNYIFGLIAFISIGALAENSCPVLNFAQDKSTLIQPSNDNDQEVFVDESRDIKDFGTNIVVKSFFNTPDTLYNFLKLAYEELDKALADYRQAQNLENDSMFLIFKGGNVLRMMANTVFDELPPLARNLLKEKYSNDFKRSDADFSVYINEKKLNNLDYDKVFSEVTSLLFAELNKIRAEFKANPAKYFNFFQVNKDFASSKLNEYFNELDDLNSTKDPSNEAWYNAKFKQLELLDKKANKDPNFDCNYEGNFDYSFDMKGKDIVSNNVSSTPDWIANSDNRTLEFPFGSNPDKLVKFSLVRSKIIFEYTYEKDGVLQRKPIGGELIDVSLPHRKDASLAEFLNNYDNNVVDFAVFNENSDEFTMKVYSIDYLAHDLHKIIFDQFERPWKSGPKYTKRLNRLMFFIATEMITNYGIGSTKAKEYITQVEQNILEPINKNAITTLQDAVKTIENKWPKMHIANNFWKSVADLAKNISNKPLEDDQASFKSFIESIKSNLQTVNQIIEMPVFEPKDIKSIRKASINSIF